MSGSLPPSHSIRPSTSSGSFRSGGLVPTTTSTNAASRPGFVHTTLTLDAALAQANGDPRAALDAAITERNVLSSQNAQLWKLVEKQRVGYAGVMKELDRVRAERDKAVNKLDGTDGVAGRSSSAKLRPSPSAPATSSYSSGQLRSYSVEESSNSGTSLARPRLPTRQQSDQIHGATGPRAPSPRNLSSSRSFDRLSPSDVANGSSGSTLDRDGDGGSVSSPSISAKVLEPSFSDLTRSTSKKRPNDYHQGESDEKAISIDTSSIHNVPQFSLTQPPSAFVSTEPLNLRSANLTTSPIEPSPAVNLSVSHLASNSAQSPSSPATPARSRRASARESRITLPDEASRYITNMVDSPNPAQPHPIQPASSSPITTPSTIQQGTNTAMGNGTSRTLSPLPDQGEESGMSSGGEGVSASRRRQPKKQGSGGSSTSPVEEMYAESIISVSSRQSHDRSEVRNGRASASAPDDGDSIRSHDLIGPSTIVSDQTGSGSSTTSSQQQPLRLESGTDVSMAGQYLTEPAVNGSRKDSGTPLSLDEFLHDAPTPTAADRPHPTVKIHGADRLRPSAEQRASDLLVNSGSSSQLARLSPSPSSRGQSQASSPADSVNPQTTPFPTMSTNAPDSGSASSGKSPVFKATRLTPPDLPYTKIKIHGSNIKTNDRGKEVLSFVFTVWPAGDGSPPPNANPAVRKSGPSPTGPPEQWQVEKLYSEILGLDASVRARLGKTGSKRLAPLPDPKLFKDHAPAKVDQRKVSVLTTLLAVVADTPDKTILEAYMQSLVVVPLKDKTEICMFLSTDIVKGGAILPADHKEGYLTKRGKNFGGWKTRYFVLNSPTLEYYESRGGQHLGSIQITGAQIGRQQKSPSSRESDDENSYRHAFLVIEAKRGPGGSSVRHVLCAESDAERDSWVELLVRYVVAGQGAATKTITVLRNTAATEDEHRSSTSSAEPGVWTTARGSFSPSPTHIIGAATTTTAITGPPAAPKSPSDPPPRWGQLTRGEEGQPKHSTDSFSETTSVSSGLTAVHPINAQPNGLPLTDAQIARRLLDRGGGHSPDVPLSSSLPSNLDQSTLGDALSFSSTPPRSSSEQGHYPDLVMGQWSHTNSSGGGDDRSIAESSAGSDIVNGSTSIVRPGRTSYHPAKAPSFASNNLPERSASPEKSSLISENKAKISGPMNGAPIPAGYKFGNDPAPADKDRERKAKSGRFWGFGKMSNGPAPTGQVPRAVFGVPLDASLSVAQIADLPAVVFRCIEYLEDKKAEQEEGIYRLSGSSTVIKNLKERFNTDGDVDLLKGDTYYDPHAVSGLLKTFLRDLPSSVLTRDLHLQFLSVIDLADQQERINELASLVSQMPFPNYSLLRALTSHLILVVQNSHINKMTMRNVGIVFSPTLGIPAGVFSLMLGEFEQVFNVNAVGTDTLKPGDDLVVQDGMINNRNSRSYADGEADVLLGFSGRRLGVTDEEESDEDGGDDMPDSSDTETEGATTPPASSDALVLNLDEDTARSVSNHSASVAAQRGLQVSISSTGSRRASGLPSSPRPPRMTYNNSSSPGSPMAASAPR
ncbi:hypothetical protein FRB97_008085 [Tulasnella sp. 331]|nr:hypothetical protein FRB97_008085 [Tulasnella sp. 331]KAG8888135.1 hypothetical protein FRB98_008327 [Tulasnella sp. 332]